MKAIIADPAVPGHLVIEEVHDPSPLPSEALVQVKAISLNRGEVHMTRTPRANWRPGWDLSGIVVQPASNGSGPKVGERVVGLVRSGAWAEYAAVPTNQMAVLPDTVTFAQAATLPVAGLTALHALWKGGFLLERNILITGATGGVGDFAIQLAKLSGAQVTAHIRRVDQEEAVRTAGTANVVIGDHLADARKYGPYALILDSVGGSVLADCLGLVSEGTKIISFGTSAGNQVTFNAASFFGTGITTLYGLILFDELRTVESADLGLTRLAKMISEGKLTPRIGLETSWNDVDTVAQQLLDRRFPGKAVLHVQE